MELYQFIHLFFRYMASETLIIICSGNKMSTLHESILTYCKIEPFRTNFSEIWSHHSLAAENASLNVAQTFVVDKVSI